MRLTMKVQRRAQVKREAALRVDAPTA